MLEDDITSILEDLRQTILTNMEQAGENASHRTANSLQVVKKDGSIALAFVAGDRAPMTTLEIGREGGKVPAGFTDILVQWSIDKGISFQSDSKRRSFAYLLGRKIAEKGTIRHTANEDVYSTALNNAKERIKEAISRYYIEQIHAQIAQTAATHF